MDATAKYMFSTKFEVSVTKLHKELYKNLSYLFFIIFSQQFFSTSANFFLRTFNKYFFTIFGKTSKKILLYKFKEKSALKDFLNLSHWCFTNLFATFLKQKVLNHTLSKLFIDLHY